MYITSIYMQIKNGLFISLYYHKQAHAVAK